MKKEFEFFDGNQDNLLDHDGTLPRIDIRIGQGLICERFKQLYTERGYKFFPSASLLTEEDTSVIFTGATITPLKRFLEEGVQSPGYFMVQKCLRTQGLEKICDLDVIPTGVNYFTMCGILASPDRIDDVSAEAYELLVDRLQIPVQNIQIHASSNDRDLSGSWNERGVEIEEDSLPVNSYRWKYGIPDIYGRGINFLVRFDDSDDYTEVGNIISILDSNDRVRAYEFGFGLESLLAKMYGFKKSTQANLVSAVIPYEEGPKEKLVNALVTSVVLYHFGIEPGRGKARHILKKHVKGLSFLRRKIGISIDQIKDYSDLYEQAEFMEVLNSGSKLIAGIMAYEGQLAKFIDYARNQVHAHKLRNEMGECLVQKLRKVGENMGILTPEIENVVSTVLI